MSKRSFIQKRVGYHEIYIKWWQRIVIIMEVVKLSFHQLRTYLLLYYDC